VTAYTPTMSRLRDEYVALRAEHYGFADLYAEEWDRALAEHDREAAEKAWGEGYLRGYRDRRLEKDFNPHQEETT